MPRAFARISFTPSVKREQQRYGSREANQAFELSEDSRDRIGEREAEFIAERDSFYQATVSESGWPYVQHRGGPNGFLKVLDAGTIGYADFRGNRQYLSVGNLAADDRVSLILMDYANRRRLKIWGRARVVHEHDDPELVARLEVPEYRARVERGIVIAVEACDWNCPQHITPRYTEADLERLLVPLREQLAEAQARATSPAPAVLGDGPLELVVSGIRQDTPRVRVYELRHPQGEPLPTVGAGAHLRVPVPGGDGRQTRHYSICSDPGRRDAYEIAVLREDAGRGGSKALHAEFQLGLRVRCHPPRNDFELHEGPQPAILIAGGIGITPIKAMAHVLARRGQAFHIHYAGRSSDEMALLHSLREHAGHLTLYASDRGERLAVPHLLATATEDTHVYACGPARLIDDVLLAASAFGLGDRVHVERFTAPVGFDDRPIEVELQRSGEKVAVSGSQTVLEALRLAGIDAPYDCAAGNCGTCAVKVLEGIPDHRDTALTAAERDRAGLMCICVSRAHSERLVLDL